MIRVRLYLDYIDPGSFLVDRRVRSLEASGVVEAERIPWEVRRPSETPLDAAGESWSQYWAEMASQASDEGLTLRRPTRIPWTRKAHELGLLAREKGCFDKVHAELMRAFHLEGRDVGRVDVLVELGHGAGLDYTETKAVLDVDRHAAALDEVRAAALREGIRGVPTLVLESELLEGVHPVEAIEAFLGSSKTEED